MEGHYVVVKALTKLQWIDFKTEKLLWRFVPALDFFLFYLLIYHWVTLLRTLLMLCSLGSLLQEVQNDSI